MLGLLLIRTPIFPLLDSHFREDKLDGFANVWIRSPAGTREFPVCLLVTAFQPGGSETERPKYIPESTLIGKS